MGTSSLFPPFLHTVSNPRNQNLREHFYLDRALRKGSFLIFFLLLYFFLATFNLIFSHFIHRKKIKIEILICPILKMIFKYLIKHSCFFLKQNLNFFCENIVFESK